MGLGQVDHIDIIPYTRTVRGRIVIAEDWKFFEFSHGHLGDEGKEIIRQAVWILADGAAHMGAYRVEVPQQDDVPFFVGDI